jgi:CheY-like chemotaxis protein
MESKGTKILLVGSDKDDLKRLRQAVKPANLNAVEATSGSAALRKFEKDEEIGLVLVTGRIRDVRGGTLSKDLRELAGQGNRHVYIIMVTEGGKREDMLGALEAGVDDFLAEPFDEETFVARVEIGFDLLDGLTHGASRYERHSLVEALLEEHKVLYEIIGLLAFVEQNLEKGIPKSITEWCLSTAFLMDFEVHVAKETAYIDKFQESVAKTQAEWFADISRESFKNLQGQHEYLQGLANELKGKLVGYIQIREEIRPIVASVGSLDLGLQIGERDDELEVGLANTWAKIQKYYANRRRHIAGLRKSIKSYVEFVPGHFQLEERLFFPFSSKYLNEDDMGALAREFKAIEEKVGLDRIKNEKKKISKMSGLLKTASLRELKATAETL